MLKTLKGRTFALPRLRQLEAVLELPTLGTLHRRTQCRSPRTLVNPPMRHQPTRSRAPPTARSPMHASGEC